MSPPVLQLTPTHKPAIARHFLALDKDDLRLRFGQIMKPESLEKYVTNLDFMRDAVFGVLDNRLELAAIAHLAPTGKGMAELGISVLPSERGKGLGKALFKRTTDHCRNFLVKTLFMHCLSENGAMMHIARSNSMRVVNDMGEADAYLSLAPSDARSLSDEMMQTPLALIDFALKAQLAATKAYSSIVGEHFSGDET